MSEALFFGGLTLVGGVGLLTLLYWWIIPNWRANYGFVETTCTVVDKRLEQRPDAEEFRPAVQIRYEADGRAQVAWTYDATRDYSPERPVQEEVLAQFAVGQSYPCWHAPSDPQQVVLVRGTRWWLWLWLLAPGAILAIGGGGLTWTLLHWRTSVERRAALVQKAAQFDPFEQPAGTAPRLPTIPSVEPMTNSPGTHLAFRLPVSALAGWRTWGAAAVCGLCDVVAVLFVVLAVRQHMAGTPDWLLDIFALGAVVAGVWSTTHLLKRLLLTTGIGPTLVEVSGHPFYPGETYDVFVAQTGRLQLRRLTVAITCHERASYQQGTDVRTERQLVYQAPLAEVGEAAVDANQPLEVLCQVRLPGALVPSFQSQHNAIEWNLVVCGDAVGWPAYEREFPIVVYPARDATSSSPGPAREGVAA